MGAHGVHGRSFPARKQGSTSTRLSATASATASSSTTSQPEKPSNTLMTIRWPDGEGRAETAARWDEEGRAEAAARL